MRAAFFPEEDAIIIDFNLESFDHGKALDASRYLMFDANGNLTAAQFLDVSKGVDLADIPDAKYLGQFLERHGVKVMP